jgi:hypothetical protein
VGAGIYQQLLRSSMSAEDLNDQGQSGQISERVEQLGLVVSGSSLPEERLQGNTYNLAQGIFGAFDHVGDHNAIRGVSAGAVFERRCRFSANSVVSGVTFSDVSDGAASEIIRIAYPGDGIGVMFINCTFIRAPSSPACHVLVEEGSYAVFVGCIFRGVSQQAGDVIDNETTGGSSADAVQVLGAFNYTGNLNLGSNITVAGVITP